MARDINMYQYSNKTLKALHGKHIGGEVYVHKRCLPDYIKPVIEEASRLAGNPKYTVVKFVYNAPVVSLLNYPEFFTDAFPALVDSYRIDLMTREVKYHKASTTNPPILHRKEMMLSPDHPRQLEFQSITKHAEEIGLYSYYPANKIGTRNRWQEVLDALKCTVEGNNVRCYGWRKNPYEGPSLEKGGTAMVIHKPAPGIQLLVKQGRISPGQKVLDYGAGHGRNSRYLRSIGCQVYSYDPFNGTNTDGWQDVSKKKPTGRFDVVFSCFVLNVVPEHVERQILAECDRLRAPEGEQYHIVRNRDVVTPLEKEKLPQALTTYLKKEGLLTRDPVTVATYGYPSSRGFQRLCFLEQYGFELFKTSTNYKVYV